MNKKEIEKIAWLIAEINAQNLDAVDIGHELALICPKAKELAEDSMVYTMFETFYSEMVSFLMVRQFGMNWTLVRDKSVSGPFRKKLFSPEYKEEAMDVFAAYAEMAELTRPPMFTSDYHAIYKTEDWANAKAITIEEYGYNLSWMP